jgi:hypothetical protein
MVGIGQLRVSAALLPESLFLTVIETLFSGLPVHSPVVITAELSGITFVKKRYVNFVVCLATCAYSLFHSEFFT